jgi:hypothetical protein
MQPSAKLVCVDPAQVHLIWPLARELIRSAIRRCDLSSYQPVEDSVLQGRALLWVAVMDDEIQAAAVTELHVTEWRKVCEIVACGGKQMRRWLFLIYDIEDFARAEGCSAVRIIGRGGWARALRQYRTKRVILEKELT